MLSSTTTRIAEIFHIAAGTIAGRRHVGTANLLAGKNNQDAFSCSSLEDSILLSVHDGCGSTPHAEFGARLAATITPLAVSNAIARFGSAGSDTHEFWNYVFREISMRIQQVACICSPGDMKGFATDHLLFTVLGALVSPDKTVVFGMGDGVFIINDQITVIPPNPGNAPDYLSKSLLDDDSPSAFRIHESIDTAALNTLVIGTDGVIDLLENSNKRIPGKSRKVGAISDLFAQEYLFIPGSAGILPASKKTTELAPISEAGGTPALPGCETLTGWLRLVNSEVVRLQTDENGCNVLHRECGLLPDDTTLVALRRVNERGFGQ